MLYLPQAAENHFFLGFIALVRGAVEREVRATPVKNGGTATGSESAETGFLQAPAAEGAGG